MSDFHLEDYALEGRIRISTVQGDPETDGVAFETGVFYEDTTDLERATREWSSLSEAQEGHGQMTRQWQDLELGACLECASEDPNPSLGLIVDHQGFCVSDSTHSVVCADCSTSEPCEHHPYWCRDCTGDVFCDRHFDEDA